MSHVTCKFQEMPLSHDHVTFPPMSPFNSSILTSRVTIFSKLMSLSAAAYIALSNLRVEGHARGPRGGDSGPFWTGCVNTILKEMGPFSASSEWHEWINFH